MPEKKEENPPKSYRELFTAQKTPNIQSQKSPMTLYSMAKIDYSQKKKTPKTLQLDLTSPEKSQKPILSHRATLTDF